MGGRVMSRNDPLSCGNNPTVSRVAARHNHRSVVAVTRYDEVACLDLALLAGLQVIHRIPAIRSVAQAHVSLKESCSQRGGADLPVPLGSISSDRPHRDQAIANGDIRRAGTQGDRLSDLNDASCGRVDKERIKQVWSIRASRVGTGPSELVPVQVLRRRTSSLLNLPVLAEGR